MSSCKNFVSEKNMFCIHSIGDSHILAFKDKTYNFAPTSSDFFCKVRYIKGLSVENLVSGSDLHPDIVSYLVECNLITTQGLPGSLDETASLLNEQYARGEGFDHPTLLFSVGELSVRQYLRRSSSHLSSLTDQTEITEEIYSSLLPIVEHYLSVLTELSRRFYLNIIVNQAPPSTADDARFAEINSCEIVGWKRGLVYKIYNELLREKSRQTGIRVLETFDELAGDNGLIRENYEFDGVHAHPKSTLIVMEKLADMFLKTRTASQSLRYLPWYKEVYSLDRMYDKATAKQLTQDKNKLSQIGISPLIEVLDAKDVAKIHDCITDLAAPVSKRPKKDWSSLPFEPRAEVNNFDYLRQGTLNREGCELLYNKLFNTSVYNSLRGFVGADFSIVQVRPTKSLVAPLEKRNLGPQSFHHDVCPLGVFRGILYLNDVAEGGGPFQYKSLSDDKVTNSVFGKAGSLFIFDADTILHRGSAPEINDRIVLDLIFLIQPKGKENFVHSGDVGDVWPLDPFLFSLSKCQAPTLHDLNFTAHSS